MLNNSMRFYLKRKEFHVMMKSYFLSYIHKVKTIDSLNFKQYKKTDTIFILGSGNSINTISDREWGVIEKNDSIGLNFWIIHDFVSTFYCFEEPRVAGGRRSVFYNVLNKKKHQLYKSPFIVKDILSSSVSFDCIPSIMKKNIYLSFDFDLPVKGDESIMRQYLLELKKTDRIKCREKIRYNYSITASLSYVAFLSLLMGYKNIVFCGVDLSGSSYFYEEKSDYYKKNGICVPNSMQKYDIHSTEVRSKNKIPISQVLKNIYDVFSEENKFEFYVAKKTGVLSKYFKSFF